MADDPPKLPPANPGETLQRPAEDTTGQRAAKAVLASVRLDKWLWAARFYKTRSQAGIAVTGGKVVVNDASVKRAKPIKVGDTVRVRKGPYEFIVVVQNLADRRGPAAQAQLLYQETEASQRERERIAEEFRLARESAPPPPPGKYLGKGRPTKKDRRALIKLQNRDPFDA